MVKTHLPQHMDSVRERMRPKHQLLILKCYPRLPKNSTADVSPNGSELSYLLYYASTRRSKLHKVGAFLEKKTVNDVYRSQSARVMVTLQILTALLENKIIGSDSGFGLIAPYVLRIIHSILTTTNDVSLIDACLSTWEVFCRHQDQSTLAADHEYRGLFEQTVRQWAAYARKEPAKRLGKGTTPVSVPDGIRLRTAGLGAIKALLTSDNLSSEVGRQLSHGIPAILTNIRSNDSFALANLLTISKRNESEEKEKDKARRQSFATVRTFNAGESALSDPRAAEGTTQDADAYAEEGTAVFAVDCLKKVFDTDNRAQIRAGTSQVLEFLAREQGSRGQSEKTATAVDWTSWSTKLFETITTWTPVQDRFIILVTATETLIRLPLSDESISQHLLLTQLIDDILRSDLNLIGLSVMDVLLLFVQQILRVLQLGSVPQTRGSADEIARITTNSTDTTKKTSTISQSMQNVLLARLKSCMSDLATHVYYTDQIADMIATLLLRLKPNATATSPPNPAATAAAIQEPTTAVTGSVSQISLARERSQSTNLPGGFFTFDSARQIALEAVKEIIIVANSSHSQASAGMAQSRNLVSLTVWEGTQWLLRDPAPNVRRAYVDAICTWLQLETRKQDARVREAQPHAMDSNNRGDVSQRAVSNASNKERQGRKARNTFLQLLHLAVYENVLQHAASSESDILLLHLLLISMSPRLGVNAVQSALPMILALQEEIVRVTSPVGKIRIGSLVHGYLWQLVEQFELNNESVGRDILGEISRRKQHGLWMYAIGVPPTPLERIPLPGSTGSTVPKLATDLQSEALRPFDHSQQLVEGISESYITAALALAPTTPSSPGRLTGPILDRHASSYLTAKQVMSTQLPQKIKDAMLSTWSKESCLAAIAAAAPRDPSATGSRSSPPNPLAGNHRQLLAVTGSGSSPRSESERTNLLPDRNQSLHQNQAAYQSNGQRANGLDRRPSHSTFNASGNGRVSLRVEELKEVLAGGANPVALVGRYDPDDDTGSESMVDVGGEDLSDTASRAPSNRGIPYASRLAAMGSVHKAGKAPVINDNSLAPARNGSVVSGRASTRSSRLGPRDLSAILDGIDLGETRKYGSGRPPY
ncbi:hypothetical protein AMS68_000407 [Peltaster fructicola]|uniref:Protein EFR3 n=1 Tax=Peltaster fructicola TaxID=286661 RepID=A0A6H0XK48_9PEZI|nr:hypothetical protein AMS68_000407 [Peltaster fructicola]